MIYFLLFIIVCLIALLIFEFIIILRYAKMLMNFEDNIDEALDLFDNCYHNIDRILKMPLYSDDPEIRGIVRELSKSRQAVIVLAGTLTEAPFGIWGNESSKKETNNKDNEE